MRQGRGGVRQVTVVGLLGALLTVTKLALAWLPNIEPVSLLILVYAAVLGRRAFGAVFVFVVLEVMLWGLNLWTLNYLYVWPLLVFLAYLLRRQESVLGWAVLAGAFGLSFGGLCALLYLPLEGWHYALVYWIQGIPFDLLHCVGNFVLTLVLFRPCRRVLDRLAQEVFL
ncbi:MAG: hypothetical protein HFE97_10885 [Oscillospiraceae bacterium]|nr:hypothetical protein [Oscillospiraceae bacterium]